MDDVTETKDSIVIQKKSLGDDVLIPKVVEFLIEDFRDTSEHLRATDKKVEFLFQLYGGISTFLISIIVALISTALGSSQENAAIIIQMSPHISLALIIIVFGVTWWLFEYMLRGLTMKSLYVNRLNFLRREIYIRLGETLDNNAVFLYVGKVLPDSDIKKVKMGDMFLLALRWLIIFLWFAFSALLLSILHLSVVWEYLVGFICLATLVSLVFLTKRRWKKSLMETRIKVEKSWE